MKTQKPEDTDPRQNLFLVNNEIKNGLRQVNKLCAKLCSTSASLVNRVDGDYQYTITKYGDWEHRKIAIDKSLCAKTIKRGGLLIINDVDTNEITKHMFASDERHIRFYAGVPLWNTNGKITATLCVISYSPKRLSHTAKHSFLLLAKHLQAILQAFDVQEQKMKSFQEEIEADMEANEVLQLEIHHRIKNNLADICGMLQLERAEAEDPEVRDILSRTESRISTAIKLHELLYKSKTRARLHLKEYVEQLTDKIIQVSKPDKLKLSVELDIENILMEFTYVFPIGLIINEIITNALQHAFVDRESGIIAIKLKKAGGNTIYLNVIDNGNGLKNAGHETSGIHLGKRIVELLSSQLKADIKYEQKEGTLFELTFNAEQDAAQRDKYSQKKFTKKYLPIYN